MVAPTASMASHKKPLPWDSRRADIPQEHSQRQTRTSLRTLQPSPTGQTLVETALTPPAAPSAQELVVHNQSMDQESRSLDGESDVTHVVSRDSSPSTQQKLLLDRADAGDFEARLALVTLQDTEIELARMRRRDQPDQTVLDFLQHPGDGITPAQAATQVLNELTRQTENISTETLYVWRYIQLNEIWKTHDNPTIRSSFKAFIKSLDQEDLLMTLLMMGTIIQNDKRQSLLAIYGSWGLNWFKSVPRDILPDDVTSPTDLSRRLLLQIAATCKRNISLDDAVKQWRESLEARLGGRVQRASRNSRISQKRYILPDDINRLYRTPTDQKAFEKSIKEIKQDRIQLKGPVKLKTLAPKLDMKRKHDSTDAELDADQPRKHLSKDGTRELVKIRNHLISRPVPATESLVDASQSMSQAESIPPSAQRGLGNKSIFITDTDSEEEVFQDIDDTNGGSQSQSCEGSLILARLASQVNWSQDSRECCDKCRVDIASVQLAIDAALANIASAHI